MADALIARGSRQGRFGLVWYYNVPGGRSGWTSGTGAGGGRSGARARRPQERRAASIPADSAAARHATASRPVDQALRLQRRRRAQRSASGRTLARRVRTADERRTGAPVGSRPPPHRASRCCRGSTRVVGRATPRRPAASDARVPLVRHGAALEALARRGAGAGALSRQPLLEGRRALPLVGARLDGQRRSVRRLECGAVHRAGRPRGKSGRARLHRDHVLVLPAGRASRRAHPRGDLGVLDLRLPDVAAAHLESAEPRRPRRSNGQVPGGLVGRPRCDWRRHDARPDREGATLGARVEAMLRGSMRRRAGSARASRSVGSPDAGAVRRAAHPARTLRVVDST